MFGGDFRAMLLGMLSIGTSVIRDVVSIKELGGFEDFKTRGWMRLRRFTSTQSRSRLGLTKFRNARSLPNLQPPNYNTNPQHSRGESGPTGPTLSPKPFN